MRQTIGIQCRLADKKSGLRQGSAAFGNAIGAAVASATADSALRSQTARSRKQAAVQ